jgi:PPM family protein phosphatase
VPEIHFAQLTDAGSAHAENEDAIGHWTLADGIAFAVADGIGGRAAGRLASGLALEVVGTQLVEAALDLPILTRLRRAVQAANVTLYQKALAVPELHGMGTTITLTAVVGASLVSAHVGDARLCLLRNGVITQLTKDHGWAGAHLPGVDLGEQAHGRPRRYAVPRCLGHELVVSVDLLSMDLRTGDTLLQCSDGVHGALGEGELRELVEAHPPAAACQAILRRTREEDGRDDASVQVAAVDRVPAAAGRSWWPFVR